MKTDESRIQLGSLMDNLIVRSEDQKKKISNLSKLLRKTKIPDQINEVKSSNFSFEAADLFSETDLKKESLNLFELKEEEMEEPEYKVFVRESPVRNSMFDMSVPQWANGAKAKRSEGPFQSVDGRQFWFDFFEIKKFVSLYVKNATYPALLFKYNRTFTNPRKPNFRNYNLEKGTIWIQTRLLDANAPASLYTGLTINDGTISVKNKSKVKDDKLTIPKSARVNVALVLNQPRAVGTNKESKFGEDARNAKITLPKNFEFHFSGNTKGIIDGINNVKWNVYGQKMEWWWNKNKKPTYDASLKQLLIPFKTEEDGLKIKETSSSFLTLKKDAPISATSWALPAATLDIQQPTNAAGIGALLVQTKKGLTAEWEGLQGGGLNLENPYIMASSGNILISDATANNPFTKYDLELWQDEQNPFGTNLQLDFTQQNTFIYYSQGNGNEAILTKANAHLNTDRPVTTAAEPVEVRSKDSLLLLSINDTAKLIFLWDDNILLDNTVIDPIEPNDIKLPKPISLALKNALFKTTPVNGCLLAGYLSDDFKSIEKGQILLTFGMLAYLPTLPDPYAANLGGLMKQFQAVNELSSNVTYYRAQRVIFWIVGKIKWEPIANKKLDQVEVSFHFGPVDKVAKPTTEVSDFTTLLTVPTAELGGLTAVNTGGHALTSTVTNTINTNTITSNIGNINFRSNPNSSDTPLTISHVAHAGLPDYGGAWDDKTDLLLDEDFALLDVSTNADLLGVSFKSLTRKHYTQLPVPFEHNENIAKFPLRINGMEVTVAGLAARIFTSPLISWEPVINLTPPVSVGDPDAGFNYYPDDGGPSRIYNFSKKQVALTPIKLSNFLVNNFKNNPNFSGMSLFTLPYGMKAIAVLENVYNRGGIERLGSRVELSKQSFEKEVKGGLQFEVRAGKSIVGAESNTFEGNTVQLNNILRFNGSPSGNSTLGNNVTIIFNKEFLLDNFGNVKLFKPRGVPLTRIDMSGYGASIFSNWLNPNATIAATSQAKFDVFVGRCAHEIIQVKSIVYPYAIQVVRTISLFKSNTGYIYRLDSGWQPESDGQFNFKYFVNEEVTVTQDEIHEYPGGTKLVAEERQGDYEIHPGIIKGLYHIKDIEEIPQNEIQPFTTTWHINVGEKYVDDATGKEVERKPGDPPISFEVILHPLYLTADVDVENPVSGFKEKTVNGDKKKLVASKKILGFVQLAPRGMPISKEIFQQLINYQGTIGGPLDCVIDVGNSGQQMRLHRFDVNNATTNSGDPIIVGAGRGNVILPKDGSWSMVKHEYGTGNVNPVPENLSVPVIRSGKLIKKANSTWGVNSDPVNELLKIANPTELLRNSINETINYGFLLTTDTQKALFLTPSFKLGLKQVLSKTSPLFADGFRIANSKGIFPNIGNAVDDFGDVIKLLENGDEFDILGGILDNGDNVFELLDLDNPIPDSVEKGFKLLKKVAEDGFALPNFAWYLVDTDSFKIYIEYKADDAGRLKFDIDSFTEDPTDKWKSAMNDVALVADLGPIERLVSIRGKWDAENGKSAKFGGGSSFPSPQLVFADELEPVIQILQILEKLQTADYAGAAADGLKLAMSNKANSWEYKLEASKEIPVLRFPPNPAYTDPNAPLKLEAGLKLGLFFNAAIPVSTDAEDWLPTAGAFLGFYGRLSVMCVSLSAATVYAVGQVDLEVRADTKVGPSLRMEFGFGVELVVGLPVVGSVSVLYMAGVEIFMSAELIEVSAFLLFRGNATLIGGLVSITIYIEGRGTITRAGGRTDASVQMTFGIDISIAFIIDISFEESWEESRQIA